MKITWFGAAALRLETTEGSVLLDPFIRRYGKKEKQLSALFLQERVIAVTHGHFDHILHMYPLFGRRKDIAVYTTKTPMKTLRKDGMHPEAFHLLKSGDCIRISGFEAKVLSAKHIQYDGKLIWQTIRKKHFLRRMLLLVRECRLWRCYREAGEILFWEFHAEGKRVQVLGSAAIDKKVAYPKGADLLVLAYQGRSDLVTYIQPIISALMPKCIMPFHFDDAFPPLSSEINMKSFEKMMKQRFPNIKCMIPQTDTVYEI